MHNLHYIVVFADDCEEAANDVLSRIADFGNENNWRCVGGVISADGAQQTIIDEGARWTLDELLAREGATILEKINNHLHEDIEFAYAQLPLLQKSMQEATIKQGDNTAHWYQIALHAKTLERAEEAYPNKDNPLFEYCAWEFDEFGLTWLDGYAFDPEKRATTFIVMIDMHS